MSAIRHLAGLAAGLFAVLALLAPVYAQDMSTRVIVPDAPGGALFSGCYRVQQRLYGPYRMDFCLEQRGTYTVRGGGVRCDGRLTWSARGRDINIQLRRTPCGNGVAWSGDTMTCRGGNLLPAFLARIIVPDVPVLQTLRCTYTPSVRTEKPVQITARRID
ncbi:hypothetical protein PRN20_20600 [Devosia sp. ZB163]|uniref:hypothetical protein n=1 Tax=Devosia sp. ZB163 TaxID=3025938 RepID=UPI002360CDC9|nr:hypothetical protein [Devosia sp. ZB163]MDC9826141.1 hypothetical protein [Devosia sp. ZB163]